MNSTAVIHFDLSPQQKAAHLAFLLVVQGREYTTSQVAEMYSMSHRGAYGMLSSISGAIPLITTDHTIPRWRRFDCT